MTDDELERALMALPLEEPPVDLRARILAVTVARPRLTFKAWEVWLVGTLLAFMVWLSFLVFSSAPDVSGTISRTLSAGVEALTESLSASTLMWVALGAWFVVWISQISLPQTRRRSSPADR